MITNTCATTPALGANQQFKMYTNHRVTEKSASAIMAMVVRKEGSVSFLPGAKLSRKLNSPTTVAQILKTAVALPHRAATYSTVLGRWWRVTTLRNTRHAAKQSTTWHTRRRSLSRSGDVGGESSPVMATAGFPKGGNSGVLGLLLLL